jgi:hypothetical protein
VGVEGSAEMAERIDVVWWMMDVAVVWSFLR